ncbi:MAG: AAA family ATPase [Lachnospiraceae bacterium]|nr:AAA family ATPase [Lachnospiraceae bacterium]
MENKGLKDLYENITKVITGNETAIKMMITCMISGGHVLVEDVPGTGKTTMAKALSKSIDADIKRIQFTPDLLPGDIVGINIFDKNKGEFRFVKGPVFTDILLADEINRAAPRTQSGLLECMEEKQVSVDGISYELSPVFFVIATQNPIESQGTFPLPEAQSDRFMMKIPLGDPKRETLIEIMKRNSADEPISHIAPVLQIKDIENARVESLKVFVKDCIIEYIADIIMATGRISEERPVSPRAGIHLLKCARSYAYFEGRKFVIPDDVKAVATYVLCHRVSSSYSSSKEVKKKLEDLLETVKAPTEDFEK